MTTLSGYNALPKTLNGIINVNATSGQIGDITISGDTISGVDTIFFEDGLHTASIGLDASGDLLIDGTGELRITSQGGVNMEGETLNMNQGEIHNVPLIHGHNNTDMIIEAKGTGDLVFETNNVNRVIVDDNGNMNVDGGVLYIDAVNNRVGINHTNPSQALSLIGNQLIAPNISNLVGTPFIQLRNTGLTDGSPNSLIMGLDGAKFNGVAYINTTKGGVAGDTPLTFRINGTERMRVNTNGRVGIGTNNPSQSLDVSGNCNVSGIGTFSGLSSSTLAVSGSSTMGNIFSSGIGTFQGISSSTLAVSGSSTMGNMFSSGIGTFQGINATIATFSAIRMNPVKIGITAGFSNQGAGAIAIGEVAGYTGQGVISIAIGEGSGAYDQRLRSVAIGATAGYTGQSSNAIAIGFEAGMTNQGNRGIAIGDSTAESNQGSGSIAIGYFAGQIQQGQNSVSVGSLAGQTNQGILCTAIGREAGKSNQRQEAVALGYLAGGFYQGSFSLGIGTGAGQSTQGEKAVALGYVSGYISQGNQAVAIGNRAGLNIQGQNSVAIGSQAGEGSQRSDAISIGVFAGQNSQQSSSIAIGREAGQASQGGSSIAIGSQAGRSFQNANSIAIGRSSGNSGQGADSIAIGTESGFQAQGNNSIAIGDSAGYISQGGSAISIGIEAGYTQQGAFSIAIGSQAGNSKQGANSISIGNLSGWDNQGINAIAIGDYAGHFTQGQYSVAIGNQAGLINQSVDCVAIGLDAGSVQQGTNAVAIGRQAGEISQGQNAIAIGNSAGFSGQHNNSIILNASGSVLNSDGTDRLFINPIRAVSGVGVGILQYNSTSKEITYSNTPDINGYVNLTAGNDYRINNVSVLSSSTLGVGVVNSSLTSVGTLSSLNVSGNLTVDTNTLIVDSTNNRVGINTATPSSSLSVIGPDPSTNFPLLDFRNTSNYGIYAQTDSISGRGNTLRFLTRDFNAGANTIRDLLTLRPEGRVGIGTNNPSETLDVSGVSIFRGRIDVSGNLTFKQPTPKIQFESGDLQIVSGTGTGTLRAQFNSSGGLTLINGLVVNGTSQLATTYMGTAPLYLRGSTDNNHFIQYCGSTTQFASQNADGPAVVGFGGGLLGSKNTGDQWIAKWDKDYFYVNKPIAFNGTFVNNQSFQQIYSGNIANGGSWSVQANKTNRGQYFISAANRNGNWNFRYSFSYGTSNDTGSGWTTIGSGGTNPPINLSNVGTDIKIEITNSTGSTVHYSVVAFYGGLG